MLYIMREKNPAAGTGTEAILCSPISHHLYPRGRIRARCRSGETGGRNRGRDICRFSKLSQKDLLELIREDTQIQRKTEKKKMERKAGQGLNHPFTLLERNIKKMLKVHKT